MLPGPLVQPEWLEANLGAPGLVVLEVNELPRLYAIGHIPGARNVDVRTELQDPVMRDLPDAEAIRSMWARVGLTEGASIVIYGDRNNWFAAFAFWVFRYFGLQELALLDGGRQRWIAEKRPMTDEVPTAPPAGAVPSPQPDQSLRASAEDLFGSGAVVLDVRTPEEYRGEVMSEAAYPDEAALRAGHVPGALSAPWDEATSADGRFLDPDSLRAIYADLGIAPDTDVISYCRVGERSAHTWFVLHELLGLDRVRNYDGSWTEWGSMIGMPVVVGSDPGVLPPVPAELGAPPPR